jgi:predicted PurR-regulated permease PerM
MDKVQLPGYLRVLTISLLVILIIYTLVLGRAILIPIFLAGFMAMLLTPLCSRLEQHRIPRIPSALISIFLALGIIVGMIWLTIAQLRSFAGDLDGVGGTINDYLIQLDVYLYNRFQIVTDFAAGVQKDRIAQYIQTNSETLSGFFLNTIGSLTGVVIVPVFIFFFIIYRNHLTIFVAKFFEKHKENTVKSELLSIRQVVQYYILGILKVMAILAVLNTAALYALGIKHAIFFGIFAALLNIIPYLGPFLGAILPFIYAFLTTDSLFYPLAIVVLFTIIQMIESNFLTPKIVGSNVQLNALITFVGLLVGGAIWGIAGMILIIPIMAILKRIFQLVPAAEPFAHLFGEEKNLTEK